MYAVFDKWPEISYKSFNSDQKSVELKKVNHIVFAGMGGSGTIGDIFSTILSKTDIHVTTVKGYLLPKTVISDTLVIVTSVSGNTKETLAVLKAAKNLKCNIIAFCSGGKMEQYCIRNNIEYRIITEYHSPRASFTSYLYTILNVLHSTLKIKKIDVLNSIKQLEKLSQKINSSNLTKSNPSLELAKWITDIPIIYYPYGLQSAGIRFKNSLQENAKIHVMVEDVVEACHNGIVAWSDKSSVKPILIQGSDDYIKTKERWLIVKKFFDSKNIDCKIIKSNNGSILEKIVGLVYLLDYASIYLAIIKKIDPTPVEAIFFVKSNL